ncbi:MAG: DUF3108 domain-containing protein [Sideroxydans sp.]|nr:DUF3108 domain-containing protein [Sideroxydans sp.]
MIALLRTPARRIAFAVALSVLVHVLLLWLPHVSPPHYETQLPLLTAKLEAIPMRPHQPAPHKHRPAPRKPKPETPESRPPVAQAILNTPAASSVPAATETPVAEETAASGVPVTTGDDTNTADKTNIPVLPRHAQLRFAAYMGTHGLYIGEMRHTLDISEDGHYTLQAELETVGLASLFKDYHLNQASSGMLTKNGDLHPEKFSEKRIDEHGTQEAGSSFDWAAQQLDFTSGTKEPLPAGTQDILSFLYQLSQESFNRELIPLAISNGKKLENYQLEVGAEEDIITPMGKIRALHLRKLHGPGEEGLEIWLGLEYRMLPVKFRQIERSGEIAGELVIKEIRISDE